MPALRLLMIEDSPVDAKLILGALRTSGRPVESERVDTEDGLRAALARGGWDAITCDWAMPKFSAPAALEILKASGHDVPFIIVSGTVGEELAVDAMRAGAHDYVLKDRLARLAPAIERELREAAARARQRLDAESLRATEQRYRQIVETSSQGIWVVDGAGHTEFVNPRLCAMLQADDPNGCEPHEHLAPGEQARYDRALATLAAGGTVQDDLRLVRRDGTTLELLFEASPIRNAAGEIAGSFAMLSDVTERNRAAQSLRIAESRFRALWESEMLLMTIVGEHGRIIDVNAAFTRVLGYSREQLIGKIEWGQLTPSEWATADDHARAQLTAFGATPAWEKELLTADGRRVPILASVFLLPAPAPQAVAIALDLSERKRVDRALYERARIATAIAEISMAAVHSASFDAMLQRCAELIASCFRAATVRIWVVDSAHDTMVLRAATGLHREDQASVLALSELGVSRTGWPRDTEVGSEVVRMPRTATDRAWAAEHGLAGFGACRLIVGGELVGLVAMFTREPVTDPGYQGLRTVSDAIALGIQRAEAERLKDSLESQLRQAQKMEAIGSLAGGIAHDFNNILSVIISYADFMAEAMPPDDPMQADVSEIERAAQRAATLTGQLLAFSRRQVLQPRVLDLNSVIRGLQTMLRRLLSEDVELVIVEGDGIGNVSADPGQIEQVLMNLVVNARDAIASAGKVTITTAAVVIDAEFAATHVGAVTGPHVKVSVSDTGSGMSAEIRARIFEPFYTTKSAGKGTGLGLSTVFGIVRQSGGTVWVESEPGVGTRFDVYFPVIEAIAVAAPVAPAPTYTRGTETVLLCEDEQALRTLVREILTRNGYRVLEAKSGDEALALAQRGGTIDLLVTDVVMPVMSGREVAERLLVLRPAMKVLYMSGYTDDAIVRHGVSQEGVAFLQKPVRPEALARKVREVLDAPNRSMSPSGDSRSGGAQRGSTDDQTE